MISHWNWFIKSLINKKSLFCTYPSYSRCVSLNVRTICDWSILNGFSSIIVSCGKQSANPVCYSKTCWFLSFLGKFIQYEFLLVNCNSNGFPGIVCWAVDRIIPSVCFGSAGETLILILVFALLWTSWHRGCSTVVKLCMRNGKFSQTFAGMKATVCPQDISLLVFFIFSFLCSLCSVLYWGKYIVYFEKGIQNVEYISSVQKSSDLA